MCVFFLIEIENLTNKWEDSLNVAAELIRFNNPFTEINHDLRLLSQHISAKHILFKRKLRLVHNLRLHFRFTFLFAVFFCFFLHKYTKIQ